CTERTWALPPEGFNTEGLPAIENPPGAPRFEGTLTDGGVAWVSIYWGTSDEGTDTSAWANVISVGRPLEGEHFSVEPTGLLYGVQYYYRSFATNAIGFAWATNTVAFKKARPVRDRLPVSDGLVLWLDADDPITIETNNVGLVTQWRDKSGFDNHAFGGPGVKIVSSNTLNGRGLIHNQSQAAHLDFITPVRAQESTVFIMYRQWDTPGVWLNPLDKVGAGQNHLHMIRDDNTRTLQKGTGNQNLFTTFPANAWHIQSFQMLLGEYRLWVDGIQTGPSPSIQPFSPFEDVGNIYGDFGEVIIYDRPLNPDEHDRVGSYLQDKYGIAGAYSSNAVTDHLGFQHPVVTNLTPTTADVVAEWLAPDSEMHGTLYLGTTDGGTNPAAWSGSVGLGTLSDASIMVTQNLAVLTPDTIYYYAFRA
ncbi:MAG: hypothetical protein AAF492_26720, partial [Verrucomicrobiota bacterium]